MKKIIMLVLTSCFITACSSENHNALKVCSKARSTIEIKYAQLNVENACTSEQLSQGLMFRKKLEENTGMLFVFSQEQTLNFWMRNTYIPLDIAYINNKNEIVDIQSMKPLDETAIVSKAPASYALEVNSGWFKKNNINVGDKIYIK